MVRVREVELKVCLGATSARCDQLQLLPLLDLDTTVALCVDHWIAAWHYRGFLTMLSLYASFNSHLSLSYTLVGRNANEFSLLPLIISPCHRLVLGMTDVFTCAHQLLRCITTQDMVAGGNLTLRRCVGPFQLCTVLSGYVRRR